MPLIHTVEPEQASGEVAQIYAEMQQAFNNWVPNGFKIWSANPLWLKQQWEYIGYYMQHKSLSFPLLTMIRMLVSVDRDCSYCVGLNEGMLINMVGLTPEQVAAIKRDPSLAPLSEKEKAMLLFVLKGVKQAKQIGSEDMQALRALGWADSEILDGLTHGARQLAADVVFSAFHIEHDF